MGWPSSASNSFSLGSKGVDPGSSGGAPLGASHIGALNVVTTFQGSRATAESEKEYPSWGKLNSLLLSSRFRLRCGGSAR